MPVTGPNALLLVSVVSAMAAPPPTSCMKEPSVKMIIDPCSDSSWTCLETSRAAVSLSKPLFKTLPSGVSHGGVGNGSIVSSQLPVVISSVSLPISMWMESRWTLGDVRSENSSSCLVA